MTWCLSPVRLFLCFLSAWYDYDLKSYQRDRQESESGELHKRFDDRVQQLQQQSIDAGDLIRRKSQAEAETEWQKQVKNKKGDDYYKNIKEVTTQYILPS